MNSRHFLWALAAVAVLPAFGQITVENHFTTPLTIPDRGQAADVRVLNQLGLSSVTGVAIDLSLTGAGSSLMRFGDLYATLTYGTASESERVSVLLNRSGVTAASPWGSSLGSAAITLDDALGSTNVFAIASGTGIYQADGRLSVDPLGAPVAYNPADVTAGLSALSGGLLSSNTWTLMLADTRQGGAARLSEWTLRVTGLPAAGGTLNPGSGGKVSDAAGAAGATVGATLATAGTGANGVTAAVTDQLTLNGGLSGGGDLTKTGAGNLVLAGSAAGFSGHLQVDDGRFTMGTGTSLGAGTGSLLVAAGATLGGTGTINLGTVIEGLHAPGNSPGLQTFSTGLSYADGSTLQWEIAGNTLAARGTDYDGIDLTGGDLTIDPLASLAILASGADYSQSAWGSPRMFAVIDFSGGGTVSGEFLLDTSGAGSFDAFGSWSTVVSGGGVTALWTPVPEPGVFLLGGMGTLLLLSRRRPPTRRSMT